MRAISVRPAALRRNSTSLTFTSNLAAGSYAAWAARDPLTSGTPAAPNAVIFLRKLRRPKECLSMLASLEQDCATRCDPRSVFLSAEFEHGFEKFTHAGECRLVGSCVVADMRPLLDARIGKIVRLPRLDVEDAAVFALLERAIARRLIRREGRGHRDRRVVVCVMGIGELGELDVGTRLLQPLHVGPARADRDVVVGDAVEQTDRLAGCLVVAAVLDVARRVEPNMGGKVSALRCIHLAKPLIGRIDRGNRAFGGT